MKIFILFTLLLTGLAQASNIEKIIGDNDLVPVNAEGTNVPLKYRDLINGFGKINMGCTATHLGNGYVLTAGHCFFATANATYNEACDDIFVEWGLREGVAPYMKSQCEKIVVKQMDDLNDYAIFKVSPIPPVAIAPEMQRRAAIGDTLTIFSHPNELPLHWSRLCGVERLNHPGLMNNTLQHQCDTNPGSSGASLINALTLKVIGIHDGGIDGDTYGADPAYPALRTGMNYGTFIMNSPLYEALRDLGFN